MGHRPNQRYEGRCHCGAVRFEIETDIPELTMCDCSMCRRRNAVMVKVHESRFTLLAGAEALAEYQFHTRTARHYFCRTCGIYTHHQRRSNPNQFGINVACIEGFSPFDFPEVQVMDGVSHPSDSGSAARVAGIIRFEQAK